MNENVKTYIPYGAAALGAVLGNVLYKKYPKFGTAGRLLAIGLGAVSGYYISDKIVGDEDGGFFNALGAAGGGGSDKKCAQWCEPYATPMRDLNGKCTCVPKLTMAQPIGTATRNFYSNAVGLDERLRRRRCRAHANDKFDCHRLMPFNPQTCQCEPVSGIPQN